MIPDHTTCGVDFVLRDSHTGVNEGRSSTSDPTSNLRKRTMKVVQKRGALMALDVADEKRVILMEIAMNF